MRRRSVLGVLRPAIVALLPALLWAGGCGETRSTGESDRSFQIVGELPTCCRGEAAEDFPVSAGSVGERGTDAESPGETQASEESIPTERTTGEKAGDGDAAVPASPVVPTSQGEGVENMAFTLTSSAFENGKPIPKKYTGEGSDVSPPLEWKGVPAGTRELALICEDPDAPTKEPWVHWVIYKIPPEVTSLPENVAKTSRLSQPQGALQGKNSWPSGQTIGYRGPMPPPGHGRHRYYFRLYALDAKLVIEPGVTKSVLWLNLKDHIVGQAELMGTYER